MSKILKNVKFSFILCAGLICFWPATVQAQCTIKKTAIKNGIKANTLETLHYTRTDSSYHAVGLQMEVVKVAGKRSVNLNVKYLGDALRGSATAINLNLANGNVLNAPLSLSKTGKTDEPTIVVSHYQMNLTLQQLGVLTQEELKTIELSSSDTTLFSIPVSNASFVKEQTNCLYNELFLKKTK